MRYILALVLLSSLTGCAAKPIQLFNGKNRDGWCTYTSATKFENPGIFVVGGGNLLIHGGSGDKAYYGGIITKESYSNYRLTLEYKWPGPTYGDRKNAARDSGIVLHCVG